MSNFLQLLKLKHSPWLEHKQNQSLMNIIIAVVNFVDVVVSS
jgi:hypothetical protein